MSSLRAARAQTVPALVFGRFTLFFFDNAFACLFSIVCLAGDDVKTVARSARRDLFHFGPRGVEHMVSRTLLGPAGICTSLGPAPPPAGDSDTVPLGPAPPPAGAQARPLTRPLHPPP